MYYYENATILLDNIAMGFVEEEFHINGRWRNSYECSIIIRPTINDFIRI